MAFQGSLKDLPLPDIIQLVSVSGKTGVFNLARGDEKGQIFLENGQMVHALVDNLSGESAIYSLAIWDHGDFHFVAGVEPPARTITKSNTNLLMEAARRLDEWRVLRRKIPSTDLVPECQPRDGSTEPVSLAPFEWSVVVRIDGRRSLDDIARAMATDSFDVAKTVYGLMTAELVVLTKPDPRPSAAHPVPPLPVPPPAERPSASVAAARMDDPRALANLADRITKEAAGYLGEQGAATVDKSLRQALADLDSGKGVEAVRELVRQYEKAISLLRGPAVTREFLNRAAALVSSSPR
jgi:hypothetical protein